MEGVADEDGWITVTSHGKNKGVARTEANQTNLKKRARAKKKQKELLNFYNHQLRESKRESKLFEITCFISVQHIIVKKLMLYI